MELYIFGKGGAQLLNDYAHKSADQTTSRQARITSGHSISNGGKNFDENHSKLPSFSLNELKVAITNAQLHNISQSGNLFCHRLASIESSDLLTKKLTEQSAGTDEYPLSFEQLDIWDETLYYAPKHPTLLIHLSIYFKEAFDKDKLRSSVEYIVKCNELLRSQIVVNEGQPVWKLRKDSTPPDFQSVDLTQYELQEGIQKSIEFEKIALRKIIDLESFPLIHFVSFSLQGGRGCLKIFSHHILLDGASEVILRDEIIKCYSTFGSELDHPILGKLPIQYSDYAIWQKRRFETDTHFIRKVKSYWETKLANFIPLVLPGDHDPLPKYPRVGKFIVFDFPKDLSSNIEAYSGTQNKIRFSVLYAGLITLLYRSTGQTDITILSITKGRTRKDTLNLIGHMMNFIALRTDLSGNPKFEDVVHAVYRDLLDCIEHQDYPFPLLIDNCTNGSAELQDKLFSTVVQMFPSNMSLAEEPEIGNLRNLEDTENVMHFVGNEFSLVFEICECESANMFRATLNYHVDCFDYTTIKLFMTQFIRLLNEGLKNPSVNIDDINMVILDKITKN